VQTLINYYVNFHAPIFLIQPWKC